MTLSSNFYNFATEPVQFGRPVMIYFRESICAVRSNLNFMALTFEMFGDLNNFRTFTENFNFLGPDF